MISIFLLCGFLLDIYRDLSDKMKEIINYLIVGALTTLVSIVTYYIFRVFIDNYLICTVISWIFAVSFAYVTNRIFVFHSKDKNILTEFTSFIFSRLLSLAAEVICMFLMVDIISMNDKIAKIIVQFIVIVLNYILSKIFVFKGKE
ncbi:MAG: GtrA family protein [Bacilli bacterium]|nr:GtrA family protein [Bacilli bacterium]